MNTLNKTLASILTTLILSSTAWAQSAAVITEAGQLTWPAASPRNDASYQLTLSGPDGLYIRRVFEVGESVAIALSELPSTGQFKSELIVQPVISDAVLKQRRSGQNSAQAGIQETESIVATFKLIDGNLPVNTTDEETRDDGGVAPLGQVIAEDLIVQGSICSGIDCANSESFGFDTLRLKENNLRIHFDDTSTGGSFPATDWRLEVNDTANGGINRFSLVDATANTTPYTIEGSAPNNSLYVDDAGNVGMGTNSPAVKLQVSDGDSPTLRLEQNGSVGFTPQTWDIGGNESNFFVRNVTSGSSLPFRILMAAENDQLVLSNGNTGLYTDSPNQDLHISRSGNATIGLESTATGDPDWTISNNGATDRFEISDTTDGNVAEDLDGAEFSLDASGNLTIAGLLIQSSNVHAKHMITELDPVEILNKLRAMPIHQWQYKTLEGDHIGPMAQDFHATFGLGNTDEKIAGLDVAGVALVAIQGLTAELDDRDQQIESLQQKLATLEATTQRQQQQLSNLESVEYRLANLEQMMSGQTAQLASATRSVQSMPSPGSDQDLLD